MSQVFFAVLALFAALAIAGPNDPQTCGILTSTNCDAAAVTKHKTFSKCDFQARKCYCLPTFDGNASPNSPCTCPVGKQVYVHANILLGGGLLESIGVGDPVCVDLPTLRATAAAEKKNQKHIASVIRFFNNTIGDTPSQILLSSGNSHHLETILSPTVKSRISPAGEFDGFEGVVEYFYGFVANPGLRVTNVDYRTVNARGNIVSAKANLWLVSLDPASSGNHPPAIWNLTTFAFFTFDSNDLISSIDVSVPNLGAILDIPDTQPNAAALKYNQTVGVCALMTLPTPFFPSPTGTCGHLPDVWIGANSFAKFQHCVSFMNSIPYGTRTYHQSNTFVCRSLHTSLTFFRPDVHCYHSGPTGGGRCEDTPYENFYLKDY
jgi:hypothetical protein